MQTTVMFVADSVPLGGIPVRLEEGGDELLVTDDEGRIELDLELGQHTFHIQHQGEWVERTVSRQGESPLFVVNVNQSDAQAITTLNTLQIDLANLVGDRYVFETVLGRGGMGVVVKAVDRMLNRPVAVKLLSDELRENEEAQQIFLVEARNLATLSHPNLVAIHDILNVGGRVLMVFEYVLGENVEKMIKKKGRLEQLDVLRIGIQLARCVAYLHEHELIHRDLKPANIIMQSDGQLKLVDFGLARSLNELYIRGTRVRGTPAYMAPEQIQGVHLTVATDLYQIGISLYEMLTGKLPFASGDMAYAHVHLDPPPILEKISEVDPGLARLVEQCLEKKPKDRPASASELLEKLQAIYARLATNDAEGLLESSGPLSAIPTTGSHDQIEIVEMSEVSFGEEIGGGTNRGLLLMAIVGLLALGVAGYVLFSDDGDEGSTTSPEMAAAAVDTTETTEQGDEAGEPSEPVDETAEELGPAGEAITAGRGVLGLSITTARNTASEIAAVPTESADPRPAPRPRTVKPQPRKVAPTPKPEPKPKPTEKAEPEEKAGAQEEPTKTAKTEKPKSGALKSSDVDSSKSKGLLSVEEEDSNSLLPTD